MMVPRSIGGELAGVSFPSERETCNVREPGIGRQVLLAEEKSVSAGHCSDFPLRFLLALFQWRAAGDAFA